MQATIAHAPLAAVLDQLATARRAARALAALSSKERERILLAIADGVEGSIEPILAANATDLEAGRGKGLSSALLDRLALDESRVRGMADAVRQVAHLPDPLWEVIETTTLENGLTIRQVRVPFGVVGVVFEARPNVATDSVAICLKAGSAAALRGSSAARQTNAVLVQTIDSALAAADAPAGLVVDIDASDRDLLRQVIATEGALDLVIPRGGESLKHFLQEHSKAPVLAAAGGNCHIYIDASAEAGMAERILVNAKVQRPGVCNAAETLLVHRDRAEDLLPRLREALKAEGVRLHDDPDSWDVEFLDMDIAVRVVDSLDDAIEHVNTHGTQHSEAIVTSDPEAARAFQQQVDAACVYVNASTRFTDGGVFGKGAEIGISTSKLHARGPVGLRELTTTKYLIDGDGQVRE